MAKAPTEVFSDQLRRIRERHGISVRDLSGRLEELGVTMDPSAITRIEKGRRGVSLDDALALAAGLNVAPLQLLVPLGEEATMAVVPEIEIHPDLARRWIAGDSPLTNSDRYSLRREEWYERSAVLRLFDAVTAAQHEVSAAQIKLQRAEYVGDEEEASAARDRFAEALNKLVKRQWAMISSGFKPPAIPPSWLEAMDELGLDYPEVGRASQPQLNDAEEGD